MRHAATRPFLFYAVRYPHTSRAPCVAYLHTTASPSSLPFARVVSNETFRKTPRASPRASPSRRRRRFRRANRVFCSRGVVGLAAVFASPIVCGDEETRGDTRVGVSRNVSSSPPAPSPQAPSPGAPDDAAAAQRVGGVRFVAACLSACRRRRVVASTRLAAARAARLDHPSDLGVGRQDVLRPGRTRRPRGRATKRSATRASPIPVAPARCAANTSSAAWPNSRGRPAADQRLGDAADEDAEDEHAGRVAASEADSPPRAASPETHRRAPASARGRTPARVSHAAAVAENAPLAVDARAPLARPPASASRAARSIIPARGTPMTEGRSRADRRLEPSTFSSGEAAVTTCFTTVSRRKKRVLRVRVSSCLQ